MSTERLPEAEISMVGIGRNDLRDRLVYRGEQPRLGMRFVPFWILPGQLRYGLLELIERGLEDPEIEKLPAIGNHAGLLDIDALHELADASELRPIGRLDQLGMFGHLPLEEAQEAEHYWILLVIFDLAAFARFRRYQYLPVAEDSGMHIAIELGVSECPAEGLAEREGFEPSMGF